MQWHELVFSEKKQIRLLRHILFWVAWGLYFFLCDYFLRFRSATPRLGNVILGSYVLLKTVLLLFLYAIACYFFIYYLLPQLIKSKWLMAIVKSLLLCILLFIAAWFMFWDLFPFVDYLIGSAKANNYPTWFWPPAYLGIINSVKVIAAAAIIKYVKYWWLKQKENERLEREKINAELQLLKAQIHPDFLFTSLNNIYAYSLAASPRTSGLLLKLSDLLSYMLYECDKPIVPLDKEIAMMKDYMAMEKIRLGESIEMELNVCGDIKNKMIAPFLMLPFIENSFKQSSDLNGNAWINMDIDIEDNLFIMKIANGIVTGTGGLQETATNCLSKVQKRLTLIYPQHQLEIYKEEEMLIAHLKIHLSDTTTMAAGKDEVPATEEH